MNFIDVQAFDKTNIELSFSSDFKDKEDGFNYFIAKQNKCDIIITRNIKDFKHSSIPIHTPKQFLLNQAS